MLAHRILGGCSSSVRVPRLCLVSELIAVARAHLCSSFRQCSAFCGQTGKEYPLQENYCERYYHSEVEFGNGSKVKCRVCVFFPLNTNDVSVEVKQ